VELVRASGSLGHSVLHIEGEVRDEAFDEPLEVRQSHSSEEAPEQTELAQKAECVERRGLAERKRFHQKISGDSAHGIFSFRFGNVGESSEAV
jgi:hypothetical protein